MRFRKEWILPSSIGIVSFTAGVVAGYIYAQRRSIVSVVTVIEEQDIEPTEEEKEHTRLVSSYDAAFDTTVVNDETINFRDPIAEQIAIEEVVMEERELEELSKIHEAHAKGLGKFNIFDADNMPQWDYSVEVPRRGKVEPYIIHRDEFESNEEGCSQSTLTYYALDDILADEQDTPVYNHKQVVGDLVFGKGSEDISICYVRNPRLGAEYEVIIDHGSFQVQVLGEKIEKQFEEDDLKHSRHPRRFKEED